MKRSFTVVTDTIKSFKQLFKRCKTSFKLQMQMGVSLDTIIFDFPLLFFQALHSPANKLCNCSLWFSACPLHILAYISPGSPFLLHFCLVSESSTLVEGQADKMVSNCLADKNFHSLFLLVFSAKYSLNIWLYVKLLNCCSKGFYKRKHLYLRISCF